MKMKIIFNLKGAKMKNESGYNTKQKENLLSYLIAHKDKHTSVTKISEYLTAEGTPVGMATIYRQLDKLVEQGTVRRYTIDGKTGACYQYVDADGGCHEHFHLKCKNCGRLIHTECSHLAELRGHILESHGFSVDPSMTVFYGICSECSGDDAK